VIIKISLTPKTSDSMKDEELEKEIERVKQKLSDYQRIAPLLRVSGEAYDRQINMMLDDLSRLLKMRKK
jgi:hypothetical protein